MTSVRQLVEISRFYGQDKDVVIAAAGTTSFKDDKFMWIKASGAVLSGISEDDFVILDRERLRLVEKRKYSEFASEREKQIKNDLFRACVYPERHARPSDETSLHEMISYHFVVHTHPTLVNALMCSKEAENFTNQLFGDKALFVAYADPGYLLLKRLRSGIDEYRGKYKSDPQIVFLQNHGLLVAANTIDEIKSLHQQVIAVLQNKLLNLPVIEGLPVNEDVMQIIPAIRMMLTEKVPVTVMLRHHSLVKYFYTNTDAFLPISQPLTSDVITYCNTRPIFVGNTTSTGELLKEVSEKIDFFKRMYRYFPKILVLRNIGIISVGTTYRSAAVAMDVFENQMKISLLSESLGGPRSLSDKEIKFIENQFIDNVQRIISREAQDKGRVSGKTVLLADSFDETGTGIAKDFMKEGANVVLVSYDPKRCEELVASLNSLGKDNRAVFVSVDVSRPETVKDALVETIANFGGVDIFLNCDQGIREITVDLKNRQAFELIFSYIAQVLKLQALYKCDYFTDVIKLNAQPGLGVSLPSPEDPILLQTMAKEWFPYHIKVNSISPGNFFSNALWSHPEQGLFAIYLREGKVSGAVSLDDVKMFFESQVPAGRGCETRDIMRCVYYIIEQVYETGQQISVSGGINL